MKNVKRIFFLSKEEIETLKKILDKRCLDESVPCFELEDGTILYGQKGGPASMEIFWS